MSLSRLCMHSMKEDQAQSTARWTAPRDEHSDISTAGPPHGHKSASSHRLVVEVCKREELLLSPLDDEPCRLQQHQRPCQGLVCWWTHCINARRIDSQTWTWIRRARLVSFLRMPKTQPTPLPLAVLLQRFGARIGRCESRLVQSILHVCHVPQDYSVETDLRRCQPRVVCILV